MAVDSKSWDELFLGFERQRQERREQQERQRALIAWYDEQVKLVMGLIRDVALERAKRLEETSGSRIEIAWPSRAPVNVGPDGPLMSFMYLSLGEREVHLYSHRLEANPPVIHFVQTHDRHGSARKRVLGRPGCRIERRTGGGFLLRDASEPRREPRELSVDDVAFRAFQLLLAGD